MSGPSSPRTSLPPLRRDHEWMQRINSLRALASGEGRERQVEFIRLAPLYPIAKRGDLDEFISELEMWTEKEGASLYDIISTNGPCGNSLLHVTAGIENADILQALLEVIKDKRLATQANDRGDTALHVAARAGMISTAMVLLSFSQIEDELNEMVDKVNKVGDTALHEAVKNDHSELTDKLLRLGSKSVNKMNKERKCPLYLAVERGNSNILSLLLRVVDEQEVLPSGIEGMSPVHGAVVHRKFDMLVEMSQLRKELFNLKDAREDTPLHLAARENYVNGVKFLIENFASSAFKHNREGYFPIHVACKMGHLETIKVLRQHWLDWLEPEELLTEELQNILHVAVKYGRASIVKYILGDPQLEKLINAKDIEGNTPLHVATKHWQPEVLVSLTRDKRVNLELVNYDHSTALDIVGEQLREFDPPLHKSLTRAILVSARTPRSKDKAISQPGDFDPWREPRDPRGKPPNPQRESLDLTRLKDQANIHMVVATLIAGVTFAAGISIPEGYNDSKSDAGIATLLNQPMYNIFMICNSIAMYNSIIAVVILLWTQINDLRVVFRALGMARLPLRIALATMSMAFMAGFHVTISKRIWLVIVALIMGITALFVILILYISLFVILEDNCCRGQLFDYHVIRAAAILLSKSVTGGAFEKYYCSGTALMQANEVSPTLGLSSPSTPEAQRTPSPSTPPTPEAQRTSPSRGARPALPFRISTNPPP